MEQFESTLVNGWQPAETAPKGDVIIACFSGHPVFQLPPPGTSQNSNGSFQSFK